MKQTLEIDNIMEDIQDKVFNDELNKACETIETAPRKYIPVPKPNKRKEDESDGKSNK